MKDILVFTFLLVFAINGKAQAINQLKDSLTYYYNAEEYKKGAAVGEKIMLILKKEAGEKHPDYLQSINNLAFLLFKSGNNKEAEKRYLESVELAKNTYGAGSFLIIPYYKSLAFFYTSLRQYQKAEELYLQSAVLQKEYSGENSLDYVSVISMLGDVYLAQEKFTESEKTYKQATSIVASISGEKGEDYVYCLNKLSNLYVSMKEYEKAEEVLNKTFTAVQDFSIGHPEYNNTLLKMGQVYTLQKKNDKAIKTFEELLSWVGLRKGYDSEDYITVATELCKVFEETKEYKKAEPLRKELLIALKKNYGSNSLKYSAGLNNLALLYKNMRQFDKAEEYFINAIEIDKKIIGENHPDYATLLSNLASMYVSNEKYVKAELLFVTAKNIIQKTLGTADPLYPSCLNKLAQLYETTGQFAKAELFFIQAMEARQKITGINHPEYAESISNLAHLYTYTGEFLKAENLFKQAIQIDKIALSPNHPNYATDLNNLGLLYEKMGQFAKAENCLKQANDILNKLQEAEMYASSLNNLGGIYQHLGQYTKAENYYQQALEITKKIVGENSSDYASSLNNLATIYFMQKEYQKSIPITEKAVEILKKTLGENHPKYLTSLNNLGFLNYNGKRLQQAETIFKTVLEKRKQLLGEKHIDVAESLNNLGLLYSDIEKYKEAEECFKGEKNIYATVSGKQHPDYILSLNNLGYLNLETKNYSQSASYFLEANALSRQGWLKIYNVLSEKEKQNYINNNLGLNTSNNNLLYQSSVKLPSVSADGFDLQLLLKSLSLSSTKNMIDAIRKSNDKKIQQQFSQWQTNKATLAKQYSQPVDKRIQNLQLIEAEAELLEKELNNKSSQFKNQQQALDINVNKVWKKLLQNEAAVEFVSFRVLHKWLTDSIIYAAYILSKKDSVPVFVPLFEEKQLQKLIDSAKKVSPEMANVFYRGLTPDEETATTAGLGKDLYKLIWQPLEPYLKDVKKINYSPAGKLYGIAFDALLADSNKVLADKYKLQQYTSTRQVALRETEKQNSKPSSIVLFGDANFTMDSLQLVKQKKGNENYSTSIYIPQNRSARGGVWNELPGTAEEVKKINDLFAKNKITSKSFTQITATEENLKALSGNSPQILHIATHGFFLSEPDKKRKEYHFNNENTYTLADDPLLRSGLILSGGNYAWSGKTPIDGVEDGIATAYEISQLNLSNTELVVLSACETALGDVKGSEGVFGLQRAFKMAGVKKMIVSLWQVPDKETAELMTTFYTYWMKGQTINEAFAQAQADMRKKYSPFYWAAFVLIE